MKTIIRLLFFASSIVGLKAQTNTFPTSGNVGIGTISPAVKLDILDSSAVQTQPLRLFNQYGADFKGVGIAFAGGNGNWASIYGAQQVAGTWDQGRMIFKTRTSDVLGDQEKMTILANGNVGIGTAVPSTRLSVGANDTADEVITIMSKGRSGLDLRSDTANANGEPGGAYVRMSQDGGSIGGIIGTVQTSDMGPSGAAFTGTLTNSLLIGTGTDTKLQMGTSSTVTLTMDTIGNVGIGTTSPGYKLQIVAQDGVGNGEHAIIRASNGSTSGVAMGWWADGSADIGGYVRSLNSKPLFLGSSGSRTAVTVAQNGNVGIGTTNPTQKLSVNGTIRAKEVIVDSGWSDYVFAPDYRLAPLSEVERHIKSEGHLPGIPSATEVAEHGVTVGEMQTKLLAKIEELTLHQIEQEKRAAEQENAVAELRIENARLQERLRAAGL